MKTKVFSVRLQGLVSVSDKAYKATAFDGSTAILPKSQVFGQDDDVIKSEAYWISAWILEQKQLQYSSKKVAWFNTVSKNFEPHFVVEKHKPSKRNPIESRNIVSLNR